MKDIVVEYDGFTIYSQNGKLFAVEDLCAPQEVEEVFRIRYPLTDNYSIVDLLGMCPVEYDLSGEPINECDYVYWKYINKNRS